MSTVYLNGEFMPAVDAWISPMDRGFLFADGVYEVVPVFNGRPLRLEQHLQRLERSLDELKIARPMTRGAAAALFMEMVTRNGGGNVAVYMQVTRGAPAKRDHAYPAAAVPPTVFMTASPLGKTAVDEPDAFRGTKAITVEDIRWQRCDIKSVSLLPNVMMKQRAVEAGASEAIMLRAGKLTEGSSSNVYVIKDGRIATPPLSPLILGGITRELALEVARAQGMPVEEREVNAGELATADEIWLSSSTKDVQPVVELDGRKVGTGAVGAVWKAFARPYRAYKQEACGLAGRDALRA